MTDPFSITAGAVGITGAALSGVSKLRQTVSGWKNAPQEVKDIESRLGAVQDTLTFLEGLKIPDIALSTRIKAGLEQTAIDKSMSTRDRFSVGIWHRAKVERFKTQVESCQSSVVFATTSAQLLLQLHLGERSEVAQQTLQKQLQDLEAQVSEQIRIAGQRRSDLESQVQSLENGDSVVEEDEAEQAMAVVESTRQSRVLEDLQASCGVIYSQLRSARTGQTICDIITDNESQAFVGMTESIVGKMEQLIEGVRTTNSSSAYVGVFRDSTTLPNF
ncbi:hypothetical protein LTR66_013354 [Elasticomyces elasticus]|nr:hypothetical protein LTR66_013354 [Elasticomyces elasticus]